jgi:hypothetical protein
MKRWLGYKQIFVSFSFFWLIWLIFFLYVDTNICAKPVETDIPGSLLYPRYHVILIFVCYFGKKINWELSNNSAWNRCYLSYVWFFILFPFLTSLIIFRQPQSVDIVLELIIFIF